MFKNWKTTLMGLGSLFSGVLLVVKGNVQEGLAAITTGVGLILAKDAEITPTEDQEKKN